MKPRNKQRYLWDRPDTDVFWFSRAVPKKHQAREGRKVIQFSLGTTDRREAEVLVRRHAADLDARWGQARTPTLRELESIAVEVGHDYLLNYEDRRRESLRGGGIEDWQRFNHRTAVNLETQSFMTVTGETAHVRDLADIAISELNLNLPEDSEGYLKFCKLLNSARYSALETSARRAAGDVETMVDSPLVRRVRERSAETAKQGESIPELFERWASEIQAKGEKRSDTVDQDRKVIRQFVEFVGEDRAINSITPREVADYRDTLRKLPPCWRKHKTLKGLSQRDAAAKAEKLGLKKLAFNTINKHLSTISPLYKWLAAQPAWAGLRNPCDGLFYDKVKGKNPRPPFATDQLNAMLKSPLFTGFLADGKEHRPGNAQADDWRKWIPLVCMFSGARISEIAQLRISDVRQERGVWFIHICHDEAAGLRTKSRKTRPAAVHNILIGIGFLDFHKRQLERAKGDESQQLFPDLEANARGQVGAKASRWWREYLAGIGVKNGADGFGAHSFRHTLADRLRTEAELLDDQIEVCLGHNQKTTTIGYGALSQGTVKMFKGWMDSLTFEGVDFSHLICT